MGTTREPATAPGTRGIALPTALLVLVVLTLLGTAAVFTASTELKIAGSGRQELQALSKAEAGVHEALARLSMKVSGPAQIVPATSGGNPVASWSQKIVNKSVLASGETATLTGSFGSATALPATTTITYKIEDGSEKPVVHCNGTPAGTACDGEVVRFHTAFNYGGGSNVPTGAQVGVPVLQIKSEYTDANAASKTLLVEAVRTITNVNTPGTVRACGTVSCQGSPNTVNGTSHPTGTAVVGGTGVNPDCNDSRVDPDPSTNPNAVKTLACPLPPSGLFMATFGVTKDQMKGFADIVKPAPYQPPDGTVGKIIYVTGTGGSTWTGNAKIGTLDALSGATPVCTGTPVIVVYEGDLTAQGTIDFCGIIYVTGNFTIGAGNVKIRGAIVVEGSANVTLTGNSNFTYDPSAINPLSQLSPYTTILWSEK